MKKFLTILIILFWSTSLFANMKLLFATKLVCGTEFMSVDGKDENGLNKITMAEGGDVYLAFTKSKVWILWDPINQRFKHDYDIHTFDKEKIITHGPIRDGQWLTGVSLDRITGDGSWLNATLRNCKVIEKLPSKNIKQKF